MDCAEPRYEPRASFSGAIRLLCPNCGHIALYRVNWASWRISCKSRDCHRMFAFGLVLYTMPPHPGRAVRPPRDVTLPVVPLERYKPGGTVHRVVRARRMA